MALDYNVEYNTTKVNTPENRRYVVRFLEKYGNVLGNSMKFVFADPEGRNDPIVTLYLRVLADYADEDSDHPESLETELKFREKYLMSFDCLIAVCDRLRFANLLYESSDASKDAQPDFCTISGVDGPVRALAVFTRAERAHGYAGSTTHLHSAGIDDLLKICDSERITNIVINPYNTTMAFNVRDIKEAVRYCGIADIFWNDIKFDGVEGEYLFPLFARDYLCWDVVCKYGNGKTVQGFCLSYEDGQAPGYNILTAGGETVYVSLDSLKYIRVVRDEDEGEE
ncbi:MAG: SseB family protein [Clostridia bacterium]|nr:SseB family protein [Clostridia bacterium]